MKKMSLTGKVIHMKKTAARTMAVMTAAAMVGALAIGCGAGRPGSTKDGAPSQTGEGKKLKIVSTIFPSYDWVREVLGDRASSCELTLLLSNGVDMHSYQPTAEDMVKIADSDLFIYVGGESDGWVADALKTGKNPDRKVINLLETLGSGAKVQEVVEGMEDDEHDHAHTENDADKDSEEEHSHSDEESESEHSHSDEEGESEHSHSDEEGKSEHSHSDEEGESEHSHADEEDEKDHDHAHEEELDEHVWLSLRNAQLFVSKIAQELEALDPENAAAYEKNAASYEEKLASLDGDYTKMVDKSKRRTILFGDRFPFRYLVDDYNLQYYAAFVGCSAETQASFETVTFLSKQVDEKELPYVLTIENGNEDIAKTIVKNTHHKDQKLAVLDSMQSVTAKQVEEGTTYLSVMESNLHVLEKALND